MTPKQLQLKTKRENFAKFQSNPRLGWLNLPEIFGRPMTWTEAESLKQTLREQAKGKAQCNLRK